MSFESAIEFSLKWEGYKSDDAGDPGGRTIFGISSKSHPMEVEEMWDLPKNKALDQAKEIYRKEYWDAARCGDFPEPFDMIIFDTAVNMGVGRAKSLLANVKGWEDYLFFRIDRYMSLRKQYPKFILGWINRVMDLWRLAREVEL